MKTLDLSDNTVLAVGNLGLLLHDSRGASLGHDARYCYLAASGEEDRPRLPVMALLRAERRLPGAAAPATVVSTALDYPHAVYQRKVLEGEAVFSDGSTEFWRLRIDPVNMRLEWSRQPEILEARLVYRISGPFIRNSFHLWQTGDGRQWHWDGTNAGAFPAGPVLASERESECLAYAVLPKNCWRFELSLDGAIDLEIVESDRIADDGSNWEADAAACETPVFWQLRWEAAPAAIADLRVSCGIAAAAKDFRGRYPLDPVDGSLDFGQFFYQMYLGCLPLNIAPKNGQLCVARSSVTSGDAESFGAFRDWALASEFLYLLDPFAMGQLLRRSLDTLPEDSWPWPDDADEYAGLALLMAGRDFMLHGDVEWCSKRIALWRRLAEHILSLCLGDDPLPVARLKDHPQGDVRAKEPGYTAVCREALVRLAWIEDALENPGNAERLLHASRRMLASALNPHQLGGLWDPEYGVFVNHLLYDEKPRNGPASASNAVARLDFSLYENVMPFWLGLVDDPRRIHTAYEYIDDNYTYASGRGAASEPPRLWRSFTALLDVYVRRKHGIPGGNRLMQSVLEHAHDVGIPLPLTPWGSAARHAPGAFRPSADAEHAAGQLLDNSPYFGILFQLHYGLDYSYLGWKITSPQPLAYYPLTRLANLRHRHAIYAITWEGRGRIKRILLDGKPLQGDLLTEADGEHEVVVRLG